MTKHLELLPIVNHADYNITPEEDFGEDAKSKFDRSYEANNKYLEQFSFRELFNWQNIKKNLKTHLCVYSAIIVAFFLYESTLEKCKSHSEAECVPIILPLFTKWMACGWISAMIYDILIYLIWKKTISRWYALPLVTSLVIAWLISTGNTFQNHGEFNRIFLLLLMIFNFIPLRIGVFIYNRYQKYPKITATLVLIFVVGTYVYLVHGVVGQSCNNWAKGLKDSHILNDDQLCEIEELNVCYYDITNNWFDFTYWQGIKTCSNQQNDDSLAQDYYKDYKLIGFPNTVDFSKEQRAFEKFQDSVLGNLTNIQSPEEIKKKNFEVVLNKTGPVPQIEINIFRNEDAVKRAQENWAKATNKPISKNVLSIYIDALSRPHFRRKLKKTHAWIEQFYENKTSSHEAYQFFRYHAVGGWTSANMLEVYYGSSLQNNRNGTQANKFFQDQGFVTGQSRDFCCAAHFEVAPDEYPYLKFPKWDHENLAMFCDPTFHLKSGPYGLMQGPYSAPRRCLYGKDTYEYVFEYGEKFWNTYSDQPKFLDLQFMDAHEPTAELIQYMDDRLVDFLTKMEASGALEDTTIMFYADHGHHLNVFYYIFGIKSLDVELKLPHMYIMLPREAADSHGDKLKENEQKLIGGYDLYNFLQTAAGTHEYVSGGENLFGDIPSNRQCSSLDMYNDFAGICHAKTA